MQLGLIGLGRMGGNMRDRVRAAGHEVIGYDPRPEVTDVESLQALAEALDAPRVVWVMVPSGDPTRDTVRKLAEVLSPGDLVIDGGNSRYTDDEPNAVLLDQRGIGFVDCGVSGGIWGKENGYGLMAGGRTSTSSAPCRSSMRCVPRARARRASPTPVPSAPGTSRRWCTTASSTASCRPTPRATSSWPRPS